MTDVINLLDDSVKFLKRRKLFQKAKKLENFDELCVLCWDKKGEYPIDGSGRNVCCSCYDKIYSEEK